MPDYRQAAGERNLCDILTLRCNNDTANNHGSAIRDENPRFRSLRIQRWNALDARDTGVDRGVLNEHVHKDRAIRGDLRRHFQFQHGVNELDGDRIIDGRLNRNLGALLDDRLLVVLGDHLGFRKQFAYALGFRGADKEIDSKIWRAVNDAKAAGRSSRSKVGCEWERIAAGDYYWRWRESGDV